MKIKNLILGGVLAFSLLFTSQASPAEPTWYSDYKAGMAVYEESQRAELEDAILWDLIIGFNDGKPLDIKELEDYNFAFATLKLDQPVTRSEFATILARSLNEGNDENFPWGRIDALVEKGIITQEEKAKDIWQPITREEMGKWMGRAARLYKADIKLEGMTFLDVDNEDILAAARAGVIEGYGDGHFYPAELATRAQAGLMLVRLARSVNQALPEDGYIEQVCVEVTDKLNELYDKYREKGVWDYQIMSDVVTDRMFAKIVFINNQPLPVKRVGELQVAEVEILEKHNHFAVAKVTYKLANVNEQVFDDAKPDLLYLKGTENGWKLAGSRFAK